MTPDLMKQGAQRVAHHAELLAQASPAPDLVLVPNEKLSALGVIRALAKGRVPSLLFHNRLTPEQSRQLAQDPGLQRHCLGSTCIDQFEAGRITAQHLIDRGRLPAQAQWWLMSGDRSPEENAALDARQGKGGPGREHQDHVPAHAPACHHSSNHRSSQRGKNRGATTRFSNASRLRRSVTARAPGSVNHLASTSDTQSFRTLKA